MISSSWHYHICKLASQNGETEQQKVKFPIEINKHKYVPISHFKNFKWWESEKCRRRESPRALKYEEDSVKWNKK